MCFHLLVCAPRPPTFCSCNDKVHVSLHFCSAVTICLQKVVKRLSKIMILVHSVNGYVVAVLGLPAACCCCYDKESSSPHFSCSAGVCLVVGGQDLYNDNVGSTTADARIMLRHHHEGQLRTTALL